MLDQAPVVQPVAKLDKLDFASLVGQGEHKKEDFWVPSPTMQFAEIGGHLVHSSTFYLGIDVVSYKANRTRKMVRSLPGTWTPTRAVVAPKGPSSVFSSWEVSNRARQGAL